jgi:hypothetical protein
MTLLEAFAFLFLGYLFGLALGTLILYLLDRR